MKFDSPRRKSVGARSSATIGEKTNVSCAREERKDQKMKGFWKAEEVNKTSTLRLRACKDEK